MRLWPPISGGGLAPTILLKLLLLLLAQRFYCYHQDEPTAATTPLNQQELEHMNKSKGFSETPTTNIGLVLRPVDELQGSQLRKEVERRVDEINKQFSMGTRNHRPRIRINLISTTLVRNPIEMSKIVCDKLIGGPGGVVAVIVDTDSRYIDSIASISFTLGLYNIPCIGTTLRDSSLFNKNLHPSYISLSPPYSHQADVWYSLMNKLRFRRAFVLTSSENRDLLARFVELLEKQNKPIDNEFQIEAIVEYDAGSYADFAQGWNFIVAKISSLLENSMCRVFLVHGQSEQDVRFFLRVIEQLNMTSEGFVIVFSEETTRVALENQLPLPSGILTSKLHSSNDTDINLMDRHSDRYHHHPRHSTAAIAYALDAVEIVSRSIGDLSLNQVFRLQLIEPNSCETGSGSVSDWLKGIELYLSVLRQTFMGQTGFIMFDENDDRLSANYKLLNLVDEQRPDGRIGQIFKPIGSFTNGLAAIEGVDHNKQLAGFSPTIESTNSGGGGEEEEMALIQIDVDAIQWPGGVKGKLVSGVFVNRHLRVVTIHEKPFVWVSENNHFDCSSSSSRTTSDRGATLPCFRRNPKTGQDERLCCRGYCMDLLDEISRSLNFTYELYLSPDNNYGRLEAAKLSPNMKQRKKVKQDERRFGGGSSSILSSLSASFISSTVFPRPKVSPTELNIDTEEGNSLVTSNLDSDQQLSQLAAGRGENEELVAPGRWTGIMGELVSRRADMAFAPLTITPQRAQVMDFSKPFKFHGFSILLRRASKHTTLASFLQPFHNQLWILVIGVATHVVALTLYLLDRYSTFGRFGMRRNFIPTRVKSSHDDHPLHLSSSLWFSWSILLNSGVGEHTPKSLSGRVLGIFWSGFAMIVVASYTANLAAFLVLDSREETPTLSGIDDPRLRSGDLDFNFATVKGSAVDWYLQSQVEYINLCRNMEEFNFNNVDETILALRSGTIDALIWDSTRLEWEVATDDKCSLGIAGEMFGSSDYGIGLQKDSYWTKNVTNRLLELHESGFMAELDKKWIAAGKSHSQMQNSAGGGGCERRNEDYPETLGIYNIAGVFILFACGLVASFGLIVIERFCYKNRARLLTSRNDFWRRCLGG